MNAIEETKIEIEEFLEKMFEIYEMKDLDKIMEMYATDSNLIMNISGKEELCNGSDQIRKQLEEDLEQAETLKFNQRWCKISSDGNIAWFASDVMIKAKVGGQHLALPARVTGVLKKVNGNWRIVQEHYSLPASNQVESNLIPEC